MIEEEYYHLIIITKSNPTDENIKLDLSKDELNERFLRFYENGNNILINGKQIIPDDIDRINSTMSHYHQF